jgi:anti-sigma factor RsiW
LVALADGTLDPLRRVALEARAEADPVVAAALAEQRAAVAAIAAAKAEVCAPAALRAFAASVSETRATTRWWRRRVRRGALGRAWAPAAGLAAAAVAAALVLALGGGPVVDDVMAAAHRPATAAAAPGEQIDGVAFPAYAGWRMTGTRTDTVEGRATRTVFYERGGRTIAYTIVAGEALAPPLDADPGSGDVLRFTRGDRAAVTWEEQGRTCVLSGEVDTATLETLAAGPPTYG